MIFKTLEQENMEREIIKWENIERENIDLMELLIRLSTTRISEQKKKSRSAKILRILRLDQKLFMFRLDQKLFMFRLDQNLFHTNRKQNQTRIRHHLIRQMIHRRHQIQNVEEGGSKRKASEKDVVERNMSQTHLRAMTLMIRIHPTTVILT